MRTGALLMKHSVKEYKKVFYRNDTEQVNLRGRLTTISKQTFQNEPNETDITIIRQG